MVILSSHILHLPGSINLCKIFIPMQNLLKLTIGYMHLILSRACEVPTADWDSIHLNSLQKTASKYEIDAKITKLYGSALRHEVFFTVL